MDHTHLTHGYFMKKGTKPRCTSCGTELTVNHLITECLQYTDEHRNFNIPDTLTQHLDQMHTPSSKF